VDVPTTSSAPPPSDDETAGTLVYGGGLIIGPTPYRKEAARKWAEAERPKPYTPMGRLPAPDYDEDDDDRPF